MNAIDIYIQFEMHENDDLFFQKKEKKTELIEISHFQINPRETLYKARFKDISMHSKFGEININCKDGFWEFHRISNQKNIITNSIIEQLILLNI